MPSLTRTGLLESRRGNISSVLADVRASDGGPDRSETHELGENMTDYEFHRRHARFCIESLEVLVRRSVKTASWKREHAWWVAALRVDERALGL